MATKGPLVEAQPTAAGSGIHSLQPGKVHDRPITLPLSHALIRRSVPLQLSQGFSNDHTSLLYPEGLANTFGCQSMYSK